MPFSVKDMLYLRGTKSTTGAASKSIPTTQVDATSVQIFWNAGGIPFVKSNVPELGSSYHSQNSLFGSVENPWNRLWTSGGSSGGEAGLQASNCSFLGLASDLSGSIRAPSSFCGVYGFKSTHRWVATFGMSPYSPWDHYSLEPSHVVIGPFAWNVSDINLALWLLYDSYKLDLTLPQVPFNQSLYKDTLNKPKLKIGIWTGLDTVVGTCPTNLRALVET